jgi:hypothetical protein
LTNRFSLLWTSLLTVLANRFSFSDVHNKENLFVNTVSSDVHNKENLFVNTVSSDVHNKENLFVNTVISDVHNKENLFANTVSSDVEQGEFLVGKTRLAVHLKRSQILSITSLIQVLLLSP